MQHGDRLFQTPLPASLYHLADVENWPSIQHHGLLSTSALLDLTGIQGEKRWQIEQSQRLQQTNLASGILVRDQRPIAPAALERCLRGMTIHEWYALLNARIFFWLDTDRLNRMLKANGRRPQVVMVLDTRQLLAAYADRIELTPINTGNTRRQPALRGRQTFVPYRTWLESRWLSETEALGTSGRSRSHHPAELTVLGAMPDVMTFVKHTQHLQAGEPFLAGDAIIEATHVQN
ncbi:MAG TPA: hypothetical protein VFN35_01900 [Ktedonobacteraceae bacterium]|nr:hypothetical protein [Ktedonobacteraceae bacterium]